MQIGHVYFTSAGARAKVGSYILRHHQRTRYCSRMPASCDGVTVEPMRSVLCLSSWDLYLWSLSMWGFVLWEVCLQANIIFYHRHVSRRLGSKEARRGRSECLNEALLVVIFPGGNRSCQSVPVGQDIVHDCCHLTSALNPA